MLLASFLTGKLQNNAFFVQKRFITPYQSKIYRLGHKPIKNFVKVDRSVEKFGPRLTWILRHAAPSLGLYMRPDGYVLARDVLRVGVFRKHMNIPNLIGISKLDPLRRIQARELAPKKWWLRATDKHTINFVNPSLKEITDHRKVEDLVYLTDASMWQYIQVRGIRPTVDNRLIQLYPSLPDDFAYSLSGVGPTTAIVVHIDMENAMKHDIPFFRKRNSVDIVTDGGSNHRIPPTFFRKVEHLQWFKDTLLDQAVA